MRLRSLAPIAALSLVFAGCGTLFEPTAAVVNEHKITVEQVDAAGERFAATDRFAELSKEGEGAEIRRQFEQSYLSQQISHDIITAEAEEAGVEATEAEVQEQIDALKQNFESEEAFQKAIADQGLVESALPDLVRDQVLETKLHDQVVEGVEVTDEEAQAFYQENIGDFTRSRVSHILIDTKDGVLAERLAQQLQSASPVARERLFVRLAKRYSIDTQTGPKGGDLGLAASSKYVPEFGAAIDSLDVGEVSDPVKTQFGLHIIFVANRVDTPFEVVSADIKQQLQDAKSDEAWRAWLKAAYEDAEVRVNPRYGQLDVETRSVIDTPAEDVPGADKRITPSAPPPGQPEESPPA
jgi:parvulin-like peptidyl-prolyl isomerase